MPSPTRGRGTPLRRALLELALVGLATGPLGCWVVSTSLPAVRSRSRTRRSGLVVAALAGPLLLGGGRRVARGGDRRRRPDPRAGPGHVRRGRGDEPVGLGVLLALSPSSPQGIQELLFGDVLAVTATDLAVSAALAAGVLGALALLHRQLLVVGFDRGSARAFGARPLRVDLALLGLVAAGVLVGVQALGNLLVVAVVVGPAATARLLTRRIVPMMALASGLALAAAVAGLYLYYADLAAGASVAVAIVAGYLVALALRQRLRPVR